MAIKRKIYISTITLFGLTILLIVLGIYPLFLDIQGASREFLSQEEKLIALEEKLGNLEKFSIVFPEVSADLEKIENLFIDRELPIDFIDFLKEEAAAANLSIEIQDFPLQEDKPWPSMSFRINLTGSFSNFLKFLEKLETSFYLIETEDLTISRLSETELDRVEFSQFSLGDVKVALLIKAYTK